MFERFTDQARRVVVVAQEESALLGHDYIGTEHILLGLLGAGDGVAAGALEARGVSRTAAREQVEEIVGRGSHQVSGHIPFTPRAKKVLELSFREAMQLGHSYIGSEHILLGLIREGEGVGAQVLTRLGVDLKRTYPEVTGQLQAGERLKPAYARAFRRSDRSAGLDAIAGRLDAIASQLAVITSKLGIGAEPGREPAPGPEPAPAPEPVPEELRRLGRRIDEVRAEKEAAIDAQDFERAVTLRDEERGLLELRDTEQRRWLAAATELEQLRRLVTSLQAQLRKHGLEPEAD